MARREIKSEGKDVATAIIRGLNELGRRRDQVEVTVIQEEKGGFLGIGGRPAIVHIIEKKWDSENSPVRKMRDKSPYMDEGEPRKKHKEYKEEKKYKEDRKPRGRKGRPASKPAAAKPSREPKAPKENEAQRLPSDVIQKAVIPAEMQEPMAQAKEKLAQVLNYMGVKVENLNVWWDGKQQRIILTFDCDHPAVVIGKEGKTLESIQYLITLMVSRDFENPISVIADTQNYWRKLEDKIDGEISKALSMLKRTRRPYKFRPMPAQMRRYVHRWFSEDSGIATASEGEGRFRKVVLRSQGKGGAASVKEQSSERGDNREVALSKADLTPINWEDLPSAPAKEEESSVSAEASVETVLNQTCVLTAESTACKPVETAVEAPKAEAEVLTPPAPPSEAVGNLASEESCVLTAESTACQPVEAAPEAPKAVDTPVPPAPPAEHIGNLASEESCVLTAESTVCQPTGDAVTGLPPSEEIPTHTNSGSGVPESQENK